MKFSQAGWSEFFKFGLKLPTKMLFFIKLIQNTKFKSPISKGLDVSNVLQTINCSYSRSKSVYPLQLRLFFAVADSQKEVILTRVILTSHLPLFTFSYRTVFIKKLFLEAISFIVSEFNVRQKTLLNLQNKNQFSLFCSVNFLF